MCTKITPPPRSHPLFSFHQKKPVNKNMMLEFNTSQMGVLIVFLYWPVTPPVDRSRCAVSPSLSLSALAFSPSVYPQKMLLSVGPEISAKLRSIDPVIVAPRFDSDTVTLQT